ncbi:MAG: holo-ACP synthase [Gemmataceae bacterium]
MEILGLGSEIVECVRIREMIEDHGEAFLNRTFTDREMRFCQARRQATEHFARFWAVKEAVMKCLNAAGTIRRTDIEVRLEAEGATRVVLHATARDRAEELRVADVIATASHCRAYATATAIAVGHSNRGDATSSIPRA